MTRPEGSTPVFVDATGRRRRRVRRIAYAVGVACLTYTGLVGASSAIGHPVRPGALAPLPALADRPLPAVRQTQPPEQPTTGVPLPAGDRPDVEAVPIRLQRREPDEPPPPRPPGAPAPPRTESTPMPTPTTPPPAPTEAPTEPPPAPDLDPDLEPDPEPDPEPTDPPASEPTDPPPPPSAPVPTDPPPPQEEPPSGLLLVGPILGLPSGGSDRR